MGRISSRYSPFQATKVCVMLNGRNKENPPKRKRTQLCKCLIKLLVKFMKLYQKMLCLPGKSTNIRAWNMTKGVNKE